MQAIWLKEYPPHIPAHIQGNKYRSLGDMFAASCGRFASRPAFSHLGRTLSFSEFDSYSEQLAAYLQQCLQLQPKQRIAIMLPNCLQYPIVLYAAFKIGLTVVNVNPLYTMREALNLLRDAEVSALVTLTQNAHLIELLKKKINIEHIILTQIGDLLSFPKNYCTNFLVRAFKIKIPSYYLPEAIDFNSALAQGRDLSVAAVTVLSDDIAILQYTSGTTGIAKAAMLSHGNLLANVEQVSLWLNGVVRQGQESIVTALPLYHIFSLLANCITFFSLGAHNILITDPRNIAALIKQLFKLPFSCITGVNSLFNALINHVAFKKLDFSTLSITLGGGMAVQEDVAARWHRITGVPIVQAYGMTETSPAVTINPMTAQSFSKSIGLPIPSTEISIRDKDGNEVALGECGELFVRGPQVMQGYWRNPTESAKVLDQDGWLATGDIVKADQLGYLYLLERKKDMMIVSGFNVYPNEIENVLTQHPSIQEAAVIAIDDPHSGQRAKAFVVKNTAKLDKATVLSYCKANLTNYKCPKEIEFVAELPKSHVGKILRRELYCKQSKND